MKFNFYVLITLVAVIGITQQPVSANDKKPPLPATTSEDWYQAAVKNIQKTTYRFQSLESRGLFRAINSAQHLSFRINPQGYTVQIIPTTASQQLWKVSLALKGVGRDGKYINNAKNVEVDFQDEKLTYLYPSLSIEYINDLRGMRQNFMVLDKPVGAGRLSVSIAISGNLDQQLVGADKLQFHLPGKPEAIQFTYEDLKVWDAAHRALPAIMKLKNDVLTIEVDDRDAAYPITIDPINKTPEWSSSADGVIATALTQAQLHAALYGFTVTSLGDVNGDGFGDAAISAPSLVDVFAGSGTLAGVGAVFVFYGSANGLSQTPAKTLQPNTAVAGALFGFSVEAGDVTGDGVNDIIVGAPLDSYQTTAQGLLGPVTVTVKAGKVYVYPGATAGANPSNFIEVKLKGTGFFSTGVAGLLLSNINVNALFGFSVAVTGDLNGDNKADLLVGSPAYLGTSLLAVQNGSAFVYYSSNLTTSSPVQLQTPAASVLGLISFPLLNSSGLLFGYSVDGLGDYNNDGRADLVVGAPAGVDLSSLGGVFTGQVLGGSAYIYYGNGSGINAAIGTRLQASAGGLLGNAANLFGYKVKGVRGANGNRNGNVIVGAPVGGLIPSALALTVQTGNIHVFKSKLSTPSAVVTSDQVLESPRSTSLLQVLSSLDLNVLFGAAIDNAYDVNCDGYGDLVVGEPLSSGATLAQLQANAVGGAAYVFRGDGNGGYLPNPIYNMSATHGGDFLSVNAVSLFGFSVAGAPRVHGSGTAPRILVGSPAGALDFDNSLLNLGSTLGLLFNFALVDNGVGKSYLMYPQVCGAQSLPVTLVDFSGQQKDGKIELQWKTNDEKNMNSYEVQRSADGTHFDMIGLVFAWDNNSTSNKYLFPDKNPLTGKSYYRLKMVDRDGKHTFSHIIRFNTEETAAAKILVTPNPATSGRIGVQFNGVENGVFSIQLRSLTGHLQESRSVMVTRNGHTETLKPGIAAGTYFVTVYDSKGVIISTNKVVVQ